MRELLNLERLLYGFVEFFLIGTIIGVVVSALDTYNERYFYGWLFWFLIVSYKVIYPVFHGGHTPFMRAVRMKICTIENKQLTFGLVLKRTVMQLLTFFIPIYILIMLVFRNGIPIYDRILGLKVYKK